MDRLFRLSGVKDWDPDIDQWLADQEPALGTIGLKWFSRIRECGDDVVELMHDGHPVACVEDAAFAYVNVFAAHVNLGFFQGAALQDPEQLLLGTGKLMRHVKLKPETAAAPHEPAALDCALNALVQQAYADIKRKL